MYSDRKMQISFRAFAGYIVAGLVVAGLGGGLYGGGAISAPAVYAFLLLALAVTGIGFLRWEARDYREHHERTGARQR
jgi:hypothetical protein